MRLGIDKFKQLIYAVLIYALVKGCVASDLGAAKALNDALPVLMLALILTILYWVVKLLKNARGGAEEQERPNQQAVVAELNIKNADSGLQEESEISEIKSLKQSEPVRNPIGWYLFSAICIGGLIGGGGGFMLANFTLGMTEQSSEIFDWVCAVLLGILSFNKKWEII